jgi:hypothetical protein
MKLIIIIVTLFCICEGSFAQSPQWGWVNQIGSKISGESVNFVQTDTKGNVIAFENCLDSLEALEHVYSLKISKYSGAGSLLWKTSIRGKNTFKGTSLGSNIGQSLAVDSNDNIFALISLTDTVFINETILNKGGSYLLKFSPSGALLWNVNILPGSQGQLAVDENGSPVVYFYTKDSTLQINGIERIHGDTTKLHLFLIKFDSQSNLLWAKDAINANSTDLYFPNGIAAHHNIAFSGIFSGTLNIGDSTITSNDAEDILLLKCDSSGNLQWISQAPINGGTSYPSQLTSDNLDNYYTLDYYTQTNENDLIIVKFDSSGGMKWKNLLNNVFGGPTCIAYSPLDKLLLVIATSEIDIRGDHYDSNTGFYPNALFGCSAETGNQLWALITSRPDTGLVYWNVCADRHANYYLSGSFGWRVGSIANQWITDSTRIRGNIGATKLLSFGGTDGFIAKLTSTSSSVTPTQNPSKANFLAYPNPANEKIKFLYQEEIPGAYSIVISDILGREVLKNVPHFLNKDIPIHSLSPGMYYAMITTGTDKLSIKFFVTQ